MTDPQATKREMVLLVGPPGSGKSTLAADRYGGAPILCPDDPETPSDFRGFLAAVKAALAGDQKPPVIVIDRTNPRQAQRKKILAAARAAGYATRILYVPTPSDVCLARIRARKGHPLQPRAAERAVARYFDDLVAPTAAEAGALEIVRTDAAAAPAAGPAEPAAGDAAAAAEQTVDQIVLLIVSGLRPSRILATAGEKLGLDGPAAAAAIAEAHRRIARAAEYSAPAALGESITRLDDLYSRSLRIQDVKTALAAQREKNRLLGLGPVGEVPAGADPAADGDGPAQTTPAERRAIESEHLAAIVRSIEDVIEPLALTDDPHLTDADLVRLAGDEIARLRRKVKRPKRTRKTAKTPAAKTAKRQTAKRKTAPKKTAATKTAKRKEKRS